MLLPGVTEPGAGEVSRAASTSSPASTAAVAPVSTAAASGARAVTIWASEPARATVVVRTRSPVENAVPWTKVGVVAWPTAGRARRAARAAITARRAPDGAEGKSFMVIYSFTKREWRERELAWDSTRLHVEREVALRVASNRRA